MEFTRPGVRLEEPGPAAPETTFPAMIVRLVAILIALPALALAAHGLGAAVFPGALDGPLAEGMARAFSAIGQPDLADRLAGVVPGGVAALVALAALFLAIRGTGGGKVAAEAPPPADAFSMTG